MIPSRLGLRIAAPNEGALEASLQRVVLDPRWMFRLAEKRTRLLIPVKDLDLNSPVRQRNLPSRPRAKNAVVSHQPSVVNLLNPIESDHRHIKRRLRAMQGTADSGYGMGGDSGNLKRHR
jgi:hypothetical protein